MRPYFQSAVAIDQENKLAPPLTKYAPTPFLEPDPLLEVTPGVLAPFAASLLMKLFFGARVTWPHLCFAISSLSCYLTKWSAMCDKQLARIYSYVASSLDLVLRGVVDPKDLAVLELGGYPDADLGGARDTTRSVSGNIRLTGAKHLDCFGVVVWSPDFHSDFNIGV